MVNLIVGSNLTHYRLNFDWYQSVSVNRYGPVAVDTSPISCISSETDCSVYQLAGGLVRMTRFVPFWIVSQTLICTKHNSCWSIIVLIQSMPVYASMCHDTTWKKGGKEEVEVGKKILI